MFSPSLFIVSMNVHHYQAGCYAKCRAIFVCLYLSSSLQGLCYDIMWLGGYLAMPGQWLVVFS